MTSRLAGLRDLLLLFFFIDLGLRLEVGVLGGESLPAALLASFVLVGNPLIVMAILAYMGFRARKELLAGLTVAQISEFSIVFVAMGVTLGHVGSGALAVTTTVGITTIAASTYMILYSERRYEVLSPWLGSFKRRVPFREARGALAPHDVESPDVLVVGMGRYGRRLAEQLHRAEQRVIGVDFDPELARRAARARGPVPVVFEDAGDAGHDALALLDTLRRHRFAGRIALADRDEGDLRRLGRARPDLLLKPFEARRPRATRAHRRERLSRLAQRGVPLRGSS